MASPKTPAKAATKKATAPAAKATAAKAAKAPAAAKKTAAKSAGAPKKAGATKTRVIPPEQRRNYVEVAAYFIAERHGFTPGRELADWAAAEAEIDRLLAEGLLNP